MMGFFGDFIIEKHGVFNYNILCIGVTSIFGAGEDGYYEISIYE